MPVQVRAPVLALRRAGAYHALTVAAPGIATAARPGQFVALAVGGDETSMLLRRSFSIYRTSQRGAHGGTVEIVFAVAGNGTAWLSRLRPGDTVDVVGPLGTAFTLPQESAACTLVGGGYGSAPLFQLAEQLHLRGCRVEVILGAASEARLFGVLEAKRIAGAVVVTTDDGSAGVRGRVSDVLPAVIARSGSRIVYACGPMGMLRAVSEIAASAGIPAQTAVEESMACGIGVCMTCVLPVIGDEGITRMVRSCVEGPVFAGDRVRWADVGTVPADTLGAPRGGGR